MKKTKILTTIIMLLGIIAIGIFANNSKTEEGPKVDVVKTSNIPTTGKYCFARTQVATVTAPYSVKEHIVLNFSGISVTGTKRGTQAGPDMTNGYEGTLVGSTITNENGDEMELTYSYTVEGLKNRELEVYAFSNKDLVKKRWILKDEKIDGKNILVPDYIDEPTLITYQVEPCVEINFGTPYILKIDDPITFLDGLNIRIQKIDDSRCKPGMQCIWAGELNPTLMISGGDLGAKVEEVHMGTATANSVTVGLYTFLLSSATETTATIIVTKLEKI